MADPAILEARRKAAQTQIETTAATLVSKLGIDPYPSDQIVLQELIAARLYGFDQGYANAVQAEWVASTLATLAAILPESP